MFAPSIAASTAAAGYDGRARSYCSASSPNDRRRSSSTRAILAGASRVRAMPLGAGPNRRPVIPEGRRRRVTDRAAPRLAWGIPNRRGVDTILPEVSLIGAQTLSGAEKAAQSGPLPSGPQGVPLRREADVSRPPSQHRRDRRHCHRLGVESVVDNVANVVDGHQPFGARSDHLEAEGIIDREHRSVGGGISGADPLCLRALASDPLEYGRLCPLG
jgi:hypothetical protein